MPISLKLAGHPTDLGGGMVVRRLLPAARLRSVGPFVFFDHFGPMVQHAGANHDVRPHPHIGLATVTYLFEGAMMHRDSLGAAQRIEPGAINWMNAGSGIVHSERTPSELKDVDRPLHGLQLWVALPQASEESTPTFVHTPADQLRQLQRGDARVRVLVGEAFGVRSGVITASPTLYLDIKLRAGAAFELPRLADEMALYGVDGDLRVDGQALAAHELALIEPAERTLIECEAATRLVIIGGAPLDGPRFMWWNFVSSRKERIAQAAKAWAEGHMGGVPGDAEFIPLPDKPLP